MFICTEVKYSFIHMFLDNLILDRFVAYIKALLAYKIFQRFFAFVSDQDCISETICINVCIIMHSNIMHLQYTIVLCIVVNLVLLRHVAVVKAAKDVFSWGRNLSSSWWCWIVLVPNFLVAKLHSCQIALVSNCLFVHWSGVSNGTDAKLSSC